VHSVAGIIHVENYLLVMSQCSVRL